MRSGKPELIVPVRDRRQRRRILTLKNFRNALLVVVVLSAAITITANLRGHNATSSDDFGRLTSQKVQSVPSVPKKPEIAQEAPIDDANAADPMLVNAADRARFLQADPIVPTQQATATTPDMVQPDQTTVPPAQTAPAQTSDHMTIVNTANGVAIVQQPGQRPVLSGGFGRP